MGVLIGAGGGNACIEYQVAVAGHQVREGVRDRVGTGAPRKGIAQKQYFLFSKERYFLYKLIGLDNYLSHLVMKNISDIILKEDTLLPETFKEF